jgi:hypothetical protein
MCDSAKQKNKIMNATKQHSNLLNDFFLKLIESIRTYLSYDF